MDQSDPQGFVRIEGNAGRVLYVTVPNPLQPDRPPRKLHNASQVAEYLAKEKLPGVNVEDSG